MYMKLMLEFGHLVLFVVCLFWEGKKGEGGFPNICYKATANSARIGNFCLAESPLILTGTGSRPEFLAI